MIEAQRAEIEALTECVGATRAGIIQCDALSTYIGYQKRQVEEAELHLMACLAHIRRNFHDIVKTGP